MEIVVVDDRTMRAAHVRWKGSTASTDVLTFDLADARGLDAVIMVCRDTARREAARRKSSALAELRLYVVHGCLHLAGYDDRRRADSLRMHRREDLLLTELGYGPTFAGHPPCR
jgi:probable rRNA maturation factor